MTGILDHVAKSHATASQKQQYRPATPEHYFVLRLADRLNDAAAIHHYLEFCQQHSEAVLLAECRSAMKSRIDHRARVFHEALERRGNGADGTVSERELASIRIERRAIALTIFHGRNLKCPPIAHQLSSDPNKALGSAAMFVNRIRHKYGFSSAALELLPDGCEAQRSQLTKIITEVLRNGQIAIHQFPKTAVLASFGYPQIRFRNEVREVISAMWPEVNGGFGSPLIRDALALGLYAQTELLFNL